MEVRIEVRIPRCDACDGNVCEAASRRGTRRMGGCKHILRDEVHTGDIHTPITRNDEPKIHIFGKAQCGLTPNKSNQGQVPLAHRNEW